ncbi:MAG: hypothetical protein J7454_04440, partial [Roseiflexus sp.]|nr:hypothetical protein [Roseiflexus sp.]
LRLAKEDHMVKNTSTDLDELVLEIPDQIERAYFAKCYHIGAYRAAEILSWIVTVHDLEKKLGQIATNRRMENFTP